MNGIILVSHSAKIAEGLKEMLDEMIECALVKVLPAGGTGDGRLGTNSIIISEKIKSLEECQNIYIFADIGSSILSSEMAMDLIDSEELKAKILLIDAPLIEGAFAAAVSLSAGLSVEDVLEEIKKQ